MLYPYLFLVRHSIELNLKELATMLMEFEYRTGGDRETAEAALKQLRIHNLHKLLNQVECRWKKAKIPEVPFPAEQRNRILGFHADDYRGTAFRYGHADVTERFEDSADFPALHQQFKELNDHFTGVNGYLEAYLEDYGRENSRSEITCERSNKLPLAPRCDRSSSPGTSDCWGNDASFNVAPNASLPSGKTIRAKPY